MRKNMTKTIWIIIIIAIVVLAGYFLFKGGYQAPALIEEEIAPEKLKPVQFKEGSLAEVQAKFTDSSLADWFEYQKDPFCIDGSLIGNPELGAMGFHATKPALLDDRIVDPLNPETLLIDEKDNLVGVEYMAQSESQLSLFGTAFEATPEEGHPGFEVPHWDLHLWLIDNPAGQFAPFNANLTCPEGSLPPAPEETPRAVVPSVKELAVSGTEYSFSPSSITVSAGEKVKIAFKNEGRIKHNLVIERLGVSTRSIGAGQTDILEFNAPAAGTYSVYCSLPGHRARGMEGSLIIK